MNFKSTLSRALQLVAATWMESILLSLFLFPWLWGLFQLTSLDVIMELASRGAVSPAALARIMPRQSFDHVLSLGSGIWGIFATIIYYRAYDNHAQGKEMELDMSTILKIGFFMGVAIIVRYVGTMVVLIPLAVLVGCLFAMGPFMVAIGLVMLMVPVIAITLGLSQMEILIYRAGGDQWARAIVDSWQVTNGHKLSMFFLYLIYATLLGAITLTGLAAFSVGLGAMGDMGALRAVFAAAVGAITFSFAQGIMRSLEFSINEQLMGPRYSPGASQSFERRVVPQDEDWDVEAPAQRPAAAPLSGIALDTGTVNLLGLTKAEPSDSSFDRGEAASKVMARLAQVGFAPEAITAYLEGHWLPNVASSGDDWDSVSEEDINDLFRFLDRDDELVAAAVQRRLKELGFE